MYFWYFVLCWKAKQISRNQYFCIYLCSWYGAAGKPKNRNNNSTILWYRKCFGICFEDIFPENTCFKLKRPSSGYNNCAEIYNTHFSWWNNNIENILHMNCGSFCNVKCVWRGDQVSACKPPNIRLYYGRK